MISPPIESFGLWAEQLVAESTGKHGRGIVPVVDEPLSDTADVYGDDRVFVYRRNLEHPEERLDAAIEQISAAGHPTITLPAHGPADLGRIFFLTEFAVAVAGWALEINPFDQPNVQEAKDNTARVLGSGSVPSVAVAGDDELRALLADAKPPQYVAIMGYLPPSDELDAAIGSLAVGRSGPPPAPPPRSATARASCTRPGSCTRAARRRVASCSWSMRPRATRTSPARATRSGR